MKKFASALLIPFLTVALRFSAFAQPAFIPGDFADPSVIRAGKQYYAVGTSSEWAPHFPIYASPDLRSWKQAGYVFDKAPAWTSGSFWAPEYVFRNNRYYIYYTARRKKDGISCIGVASSQFPNQGFKDHGVVVDFGKEAIDAFLVQDGKDLYITYKAYGLDQRPIEILALKLSPDGMTTSGEPVSLLRDDPRIGMEGQAFLQHNGYHYLFYSAGSCCGTSCSYNVRVARSRNFAGPYEIYSGNPLLEGNSDWTCTGHGSFVTGSDQQVWYLHHAYSRSSGVFTGRQGMLARLQWNDTTGWPSLAAQSDPPPLAKDFISDEFDGPVPGLYWNWDFRHAAPVVRQEKSNLVLSGTTIGENSTGIALTTRPVSGRFTAETKVVLPNASRQGLVFYGDANAAAGICVSGNEVESWTVTKSGYKMLAKTTINPALPVELQIRANAPEQIHFYFRQKGQEWLPLPGEGLTDIGFLPQWDRSPRIGLLFQGDAAANARFDYFRVTGVE
ncbi:family 43 glycosylhydrolase [Flavihumibacter petaseus]|uniref:Putative glycosidase n=1 Tax=Flavihumibacter petaseus NBRC 106054 TaxID=1220578 RepID=A0A0E9N3W9_9BACT|nr:family 43 glycosylhydrolase [Flavihumibacter petaseus]GAO44514.1 putative glycosidase [Flavihumibacter petaseus NBRC 106054]